MINSSTLCSRAISVALGQYGATQYRGGSDNGGYRSNVGEWYNNAWHFDCLGFVHTLVNGFIGDKTKLGGGAVMDDFVNNCSEAATLKTCTTYSGFNGKALLPGELLQSSGHVGLYVGEYKVTRSNGTIDIYNTAECTPAWSGGVQLSWVDINNGRRYNKKGGSYASNWAYHGQLSRVNYATGTTTPVDNAGTSTKTTEATPVQLLTAAIDVINGKYGNNPTRKQKLVAAFGETGGARVQELVNLAFKS